ncbi:MAG: hypothetical protein ACR2QK_02190 [Acidimicrobiales bacterium]
MFRRFAFWAARSYFGGPAKSWLFTSAAMLAFRLAKSVGGRRELIDLSSIERGDTILIEHLPISHKRQMRDMKKERRQARRDRRRAARA